MKLNGWLIYRKDDALANKHYINWFIDEARKQNIDLTLVMSEELTTGIVKNRRTVYYQNDIVNLPDFAVVRTIDPYLSLQLESSGIIVFNSLTVSAICNNKALAHHHVHNLGIPMVDTIFIKNGAMPENIPIPFPLIVKDVGGRGGQQVFLVNNWQELTDSISAIPANDLILQSCQVKHGKDVRVFVIGKEIIGAVLRESSTDFRANFKLGGTAKWYELSQEERALVNKIIQAFDFDMVGIDFLIGNNGDLFFNEIEDVVGSRTLSTVSDINLLQKYVTHIRQRCI